MARIDTPRKVVMAAFKAGRIKSWSRSDDKRVYRIELNDGAVVTIHKSEIRKRLHS